MLVTVAILATGSAKTKTFKRIIAAIVVKARHG